MSIIKFNINPLASTLITLGILGSLVDCGPTQGSTGSTMSDHEKGDTKRNSEGCSIEPTVYESLKRKLNGRDSKYLDVDELYNKADDRTRKAMIKFRGENNGLLQAIKNALYNDNIWNLWVNSEVYGWSSLELADWLRQEKVNRSIVDQVVRAKVMPGYLPMLADEISPYLNKTFGFATDQERDYLRQRCYSLLMFGNLQETNIWVFRISLTSLLLITIIHKSKKNDSKRFKKRMRFKRPDNSQDIRITSQDIGPGSDIFDHGDYVRSNKYLKDDTLSKSIDNNNVLKLYSLLRMYRGITWTFFNRLKSVKVHFY